MSCCRELTLIRSYDDVTLAHALNSELQVVTSIIVLALHELSYRSTGLRGRMEAGWGRMNDLIIIQASQVTCYHPTYWEPVATKQLPLGPLRICTREREGCSFTGCGRGPRSSPPFREMGPAHRRSVH